MKYPRTRYPGVCMDSGTEKAVLWWDRALTYMAIAISSWRQITSEVLFRFGDQVATSEGILRIRITVPGHVFMVLDCLVARAYATLLLGLDFTHTLCITPHFRRSFLKLDNPPWKFPLGNMERHVFGSPQSLFEKGGPAATNRNGEMSYLWGLSKALPNFAGDISISPSQLGKEVCTAEPVGPSTGFGLCRNYAGKYYKIIRPMSPIATVVQSRPF